MGLSHSSTLWCFLTGLMLVVSACQQGGHENSEQSDSTASAPRFHQIDAVDSGVNFQNLLTEGLNTNILMYEYFYNGGGVAAADFNNDGLIDLYLTSNMGENALYINKGQFVFEEVTQMSGVKGRPGPWKTGTNAVDINGDDMTDLYVCYSGALPGPKRKNELYINSGNNADGIPVFVESAESYGLASEAFSTQSYFFDYDLDGDLDMLLLNHNPKNLPLLNEVQTAGLLRQDDPLQGVRLYKQSEGKFADVTQNTGISSSSLTYGLGIGIGDFNNDGWPDFYVSNDYSVPDYLYINQGDGSFRNRLTKAMGHTSQFSMGNDVGDINNDGLADIVTLDMLPEDNRRQKLLLSPDEYSKFDLHVRSGFYYQYMRNMLQLNNGNGTFSEVGQQAGVSNTDWSWSALLADYNNDGHKDLYVTNGYNRDYTNLDFINYMNSFVESKGRLKREDVIDIINQMPSTDISNYMFQGSSNLVFEDVTTPWGLNIQSKSNGAAYADLDNDGDLDLIVNNINAPAYLFENRTVLNTSAHYLQFNLKGRGKNTHGIGTRITIHTGEQIQMIEQFPARGYQSSVSPILHIGLGDVNGIDSIIVTWPGGEVEKILNIPANQRLILDQSNALKTSGRVENAIRPLFTPVLSPIEYVHPERSERDFDRQPLLVREVSKEGPHITQGDLNGDGYQDLYIGGPAGTSGTIYLQNDNGEFTISPQVGFVSDAASEDCDAAMIDANGDGLTDLYVVSGGYHAFDVTDPCLQDRLYLNNGRGQWVKSEDHLPDQAYSYSCVEVLDVNDDSFPDLFLGGRVVPGRYPETPKSTLLVNDGTGHFVDKTQELAPGLEYIGLVTDARATDMDGDGDQDLVVIGEWMPVSVFLKLDGQLKDQTPRFFKNQHAGFWSALAIADLNGDNHPDMVVGNMGTNLQIKATETEPLQMYFADFDQNGSVDPILCSFIQGKSYPYVTRGELKRQLAPLAARFTSFDSYADATITDIISEKMLQQANELQVQTLETQVYLSSPDGTYTLGDLPVQAQYAPIHAIEIFDYDGDGHKDMLLAGNDHFLKLRLGQADANYGVLLKGQGNGKWSYIDQRISGLKLEGDVRQMIRLGDTFLFGMCQDTLQAYRLDYPQVHTD